ncbi:MAG: peptidase M16 [Hyphococcus sp.]|nr:MAG: peptidase M16 [Marinicaulis sp.]
MISAKWAAAAAISTALLLGCAKDSEQSSDTSGSTTQETALVAFEEFTLDNGLKVIFHVDRSDPVVAVALTAHVGSAREKPGRTGFAHLFEHLLFLESENLGKGGLDAMSARIGGSGANGSTSRDRTNYFQTVPKDSLEKMIWAEADKIGYFINTVTAPVLAKEKQVVKNEKRQSYDNQPYGHTFYVLGKALYPEGHPYNWQVIGSLDDLDAATLDDVKEFYRDWYTPNNVSLVIAGDFNEAQARAWVEKYFAEIPRGPEVAPLEKQPVTLSETKKLFHEDNFAQLPELTIAWPTVPQYHPDGYALDVLAELLSGSKSAPLNEVLIDEKKLTSNVAIFGYNSELSGETILSIRGFNSVDLDDIKTALDEGFAKFETEGISQKDLDRIKTTQEVGFYGGIQSVLGKAFNLAQYEIFAGDAGYINRDIELIKAVTADDVMRVYNQYIKDKPYVATSFVPQGAPELALDGSIRAEVVEEEIVQGAEASFDASGVADYERTASSFDRTQEPDYGEAPVVTPPTVWETKFVNDLEVFGIENHELPLVQFELSFDGGHFLDDPSKPGAASLLAEILDKGTATRTAAELEEAIEALGANISVGAGSERFVISGGTLARNFDATMALLKEILLEPRWDEEEFSLAKARTISAIQSSQAQPTSIANRAFAKILFGEGHILATPVIGTEASVSALTIEDLKTYYVTALAPNTANFRVVGAVNQDDVLAALGNLADAWPSATVTMPSYAEPKAPEKSTVYFYDMPGAKQSIFRFGYPALKRTDDDYFAANILNYRLGGGGFASRLTQELREGKGYTYGIGSSFGGSKRYGTFMVSSGVRSNVTLEAADLVKSIMEEYGATFTEEDLDVSKSFLLKSKARAFETLGAKLGMLQNIADYDQPYDYIQKQDEIINAMSVEKIQTLADQYLRPDAMHYVIVGDGETQRDRLEELGFGEVALLNE